MPRTPNSMTYVGLRASTGSSSVTILRTSFSRVSVKNGVFQ